MFQILSEEHSGLVSRVNTLCQKFALIQHKLPVSHNKNCSHEKFRTLRTKKAVDKYSKFQLLRRGNCWAKLKTLQIITHKTVQRLKGLSR